ncbi:MAG: hypothetical protein GEU93_11525 [Propionibacteriales bacterium]|nr:hypothetical protein [Propionibacteriales bacterium]
MPLVQNGSADDAENLWSTLKIELVYRNTWRTRDEADNALFRTSTAGTTHRIPARLGGLSPDEYEAAHYTQQQDQTRPVTLQTESADAR